MPKLLRVQAAQAYMAQPLIQTGYRASKGGFGTVTAMVILQPIDTAQANSSMTKRRGWLRQSSRIQSSVGLNKVSIIQYLAGKYTTMKIFEVTARQPTFESVKKALLTAKILATRAVKLVPVAANILSVVLAARDLVRGDWIGMGLNIYGIFAGNLQQLGTFAYQLAREIYAEQYYGEDAPPMILEKDLDRDPKGTAEKLAHLSELISEVLRSLVIETEEEAKKRRDQQRQANADSQARADAISPEAGAAQAARAAAADRLGARWRKKDQARDRALDAGKDQSGQAQVTPKTSDQSLPPYEKKFNGPMKWQDIYNLNRDQIKDPNLIYPGQELKMPDGSTYTVKPGDSLSRIANKKPA